MKEQNKDGVLSPEIEAEEERDDAGIRPQRLADYRGQPYVAEQLEIFIEAARNRAEALDHCLLFGPPGLGKTTLARIIARELQVGWRQSAGPMIERTGDLAAILTNLNEREVLFIDEIHRLNPVIEEVLYSAMEDFKLDIVIGEGPSARALRLDINPFTLVGATTRAGLLTSPLRERFGVMLRLEFYKVEDLVHIVKRSAGILGIEIDDGGADKIARRSRGTPRIANRLLRRTRDYAEVRAGGRITAEVAEAALRLFKVDANGLDDNDRKLLSAIIDKFSGGPVGLDNLAVALSEEIGTIEEVIEPYLIQQGFMMRTPRGRMATEHGWRALGLEPAGLQPDGKPDPQKALL